MLKSRLLNLVQQRGNNETDCPYPSLPLSRKRLELSMGGYPPQRDENIAVSRCDSPFPPLAWGTGVGDRGVLPRLFSQGFQTVAVPFDYFRSAVLVIKNSASMRTVSRNHFLHSETLYHTPSFYNRNECSDSRSGYGLASPSP